MTGQIHSALVPEGYAIEHGYRDGGTFFLVSTREQYDRKEELPEGIRLLLLNEMKEKPHKFHQEPQTCCAKLAASGSHGSSIELRPLPVEVLPELRFGPSKSKEKALKLDKNGIPAVISLSGFVRKLGDETWEIFEGVF